MSPALRISIAVGLVLSAASNAQAGSRTLLESFPTTATLPSSQPAPSSPPAASQPSASASLPIAGARAEARGRIRGRRTRFARSEPTSAAEPKAATAALAATAAPASLAAGAGRSIGQAAASTLPPGQEPAAKTPADTRAEPSHAVEAASPTLAALIAKHAAAAGVPVGLAQAVVRIESRGNARASHAGALGLMQIKAGTARAAGFMGSAAGLLDADTNLHFGMKVLADAYRGSGGDVCRALMKYQSGHLATHMTRANRTYCTKARAFMAGL